MASRLPLVYRMTAGARRMLGRGGTRLAYRAPLVRPLRRALNAQAPSGIREVSICGGVNRGARMHLDLSTEKFYWLGTHEEAVQTKLQSTLGPTDVLYDVGAHIGFFTLLGSRLARHVVALEPLPENVERLRHNLDANAASNVTVVAAAVADTVGSAFLREGQTSLEGRLSDGQTGDVVAIPCTTIDKAVRGGLTPATVIKIDVEGAEAAVIRGAAETIATYRPQILLEIHTSEAGHDVLAAMPVAYTWRSLDGSREAGALIPGHYLGTPAEAA
jgi:FkbM family methyltransferase